MGQNVLRARVSAAAAVLFTRLLALLGRAGAHGQELDRVAVHEWPRRDGELEDKSAWMGRKATDTKESAAVSTHQEQKRKANEEDLKRDEDALGEEGRDKG